MKKSSSFSDGLYGALFILGSTAIFTICFYGAILIPVYFCNKYKASHNHRRQTPIETIERTETIQTTQLNQNEPQPRTTITNHNVENQNIIITIDSEALRELGISEDEIRNLLTR